MSFDFINAQAPRLTPLRHSFTVDDVENDLRNLFVDLFDAYLGNDVFDTNVLGMAHLGTLGLVRKSVNADGLVLLPGAREESSTRYVFRAWKSRNLQGRGLVFLKTYLQALFPKIWDVQQQMQAISSQYPTALSDRVVTGNHADKFLTSRVHIKLDVTHGFEPQDITAIVPVISSILPARFVPKIFMVLYSEARCFVSAFANVSITLKSSGDVLEPDILFPDAFVTVAVSGNASITLRSSGTVRI